MLLKGSLCLISSILYFDFFWTDDSEQVLPVGYASTMPSQGSMAAGIQIEITEFSHSWTNSACERAELNLYLSILLAVTLKNKN